MPSQYDIKLQPHAIDDDAALRAALCKQAKLKEHQIGEAIVRRRSIDARQSPVYRLRVEVFSPEEIYTPEAPILDQYRDVSEAPEVVIVGFGPAGMFCALELIELGLKPIVIERGKDVRARRRDLRAIQQFGQVDPDSNYCFGEGGAGTYSDGKLYTRSLKRGNYWKALRMLVEHGAQPEILIDAHPHIGSNKLPKVVSAMRETILRCGGEIKFGHRVTDIQLDKTSRQITGLVAQHEEGEVQIRGRAYVLATGHSARDIYQLLFDKQVRIEAKPFAIGVRIEHPQPLIDKIQYRQSPRHEKLPASSYKLVSQVEDRGVFSFCMCPGGLVVPAATASGELVVNGMSLSRRDSPYANSGTVVAVELEDLPQGDGPAEFAGLRLQQQVEKTMYEATASPETQCAPAQRLTDFVAGKVSRDLPDTSYIPGLAPAPLHQLLPDSIYSRLQQGIKDFSRKMRGYFTEEANVIGTESRTSSPVRIPRDRKTYLHPDFSNFYPCGEGAGYAGGILSAAMDGQNVARAIAETIQA
ncbi:MAG: FAD-dependent protein [Bacteroidota bacterium]